MNDKIVDILTSERARTGAERDAALARLETLNAEYERLDSALEIIGKYAQIEAKTSRGTEAGQVEIDELTSDRPDDLSAYDVTIPQAAEIVLRRNGKPMKNRQIAQQIMDGGFRYDKAIKHLRNSVGVMLIRRAKDGKTFHKLAPGVFGLLEWVENKAPEAVTAAPGAEGSPTTATGR